MPGPSRRRYCALVPSPLSANELIAHLNLRSKTGAFKCAIKTLLDDGFIEYTPDSFRRPETGNAICVEQVLAFG